MQSFKDMPIRRKLTLVMALTSGTAILLTSLLIIGHQVFMSRLAVVDDLHAVAKKISEISLSALAAHDLDRTESQLAVLQANPDILTARIFDSDGDLMAEYAKPGTALTPVGSEPAGEKWWDEGRYMVLSHVILTGNEPVGTLVLVHDRSPQQLWLRYSILGGAILIVAAMIVSLLLAVRLQGVVSRPIWDLAEVMGTVAMEKDFTRRAPPGGRDEVGLLVDAFNKMLDEIQKRDRDLRVSEERFRQLTESITQVFWLSNVAKTEMLYISPAYEEIWGRTCHQLYKTPKDWIEAIHPEDRARVAEAAHTKQAQGEYDEEYRIERPGGAIRWIRDRAFPIRDADGEIRRVAGVAEDITERKRAEEELRLQGEIARNMEEGINLVRARDGVMVYANPKFERMFGYGPGELVGQPVELINARSVRSPENIAREIASALRRGGNWNGEVHNRKKNGTEFWCHANVSTFDHPEYGPVWISVHTDITERKRAEKKLQEAEAKYRHLVERVPAITYIAEVGQKSPWHYISPQVERMLGFSAEEWLADPGLWLRQIHPDDRTQMAMFDAQTLATGKFSQDYRFIARDGRVVWCRDEGVLVRDTNGGPPLLDGVIYDVTERKLAEQAVRDSEATLHGIVSTASDGIITIDDCGIIQSFNPAAAAMFGYEASEVTGRNVSILMPEPHSGEHEGYVASYLKTGHKKVIGTSREIVGKRKDGTAFPIEISVGEVQLGERRLFTGIVRDITERKRAEQALRSLQQEQQAILNSVPSFIWYKDCHNRIIRLNQSAAASMGKTVAEVEGRQTEELYPDEAAKYYRDDLEVINSGQPKLGIVEPLLTASGEKRWIQTDKVPFRNECGEIIGLIVCAADVTERKQIEQALRTQGRVLENMVEGVLVYDDQDHITFTNLALDAMFGYARGELLGQSTFVLNPFPPETSARIAMEIRNHLQTHESLEREFINRRKDGSEFVSDSRISRLQIDGQWVQVAVVQDVTKRKWMEKEILEVSDREQRRIGQDLHDGLCQLLTGTTFASKTLEQKLQATNSPAATEAGEIAELLRRANIEARNIARGLHPLELDAGGLAAALHELAFNVQSLFNVDCRFHCEQPIDLADKGKAIHVYRIAQEAINNALKHSQAKHIGVTLTRANGNVTLTVDDDGVGLPEQLGKGGGMGLNIMAYRAKMIGGTVHVRRGAERGTVVSLEFPN